MPTEEQIETWSKAFDRLVEANKRLAKAIATKDKAKPAIEKDHEEALAAYDKASEELG